MRNIIENASDSSLSSPSRPSMMELDEALKLHRKERRRKYLGLTQCGRCCPCYACTHPLRQHDSFYPDDEEEDEVTDNVALAFAHMRRLGGKQLPDRPLIASVPKFQREFRKVMAETRERSIRNEFLDMQLKFFQFLGTWLLKLVLFLVHFLLRPFCIGMKPKNAVADELHQMKSVLVNERQTST